MVRAPIVLLHGSANGSFSWGTIRNALVKAGETVFAPDMLGYGQSPAPTAAYGIAEEIAFLQHWLEQHGVGEFHLVTHSLGTMYGLHLRRAIEARVTRLTLIDPLMVSVLREFGEEAAMAEMEIAYQLYTGRLPDQAAAAQGFVEHWSGPRAWESIGSKTRTSITSLVPKVELEMIATRTDDVPLRLLTAHPPPTTILVGENTRIAPRATAVHLAQALQTRVQIVPGAGHMIPQTHAPEVIAAILKRQAP